MSAKKCFVVLVVAVCLATTLWGQEPNDVNYIEQLKDPNEEIGMLQDKIEQLENVIETQQNTISQLNQKLDEQTKEIKRLKTLCSQAGIDISPSKNIKPSKVESQNLSNVTLSQLYEFCKEPMTDLQKEEQYKINYKGKLVQWTGKVLTVRTAQGRKESMEHYYVDFIYTQPDNDEAEGKTLIEVTVEFDELLKQRLLSLNKGSNVTYQGKLPDSYNSLASLPAKTNRPTKANRSKMPGGDITGAGTLLLTEGRIVSP